VLGFFFLPTESAAAVQIKANSSSYEDTLSTDVFVLRVGVDAGRGGRGGGRGGVARGRKGREQEKAAGSSDDNSEEGERRRRRKMRRGMGRVRRLP